MSAFFVGKNVYSQTEFIENKGQWNKEVRFMSNAGNGAFFLNNKGFTVVQHNPRDIEKIVDKIHGSVRDKQTTETQTLHSHAYKVEFLNANSNAEILPDKALPSVNNYFIGNDKSKWATDCKTFKGVTYKNIYPNIDIRFYSDAGANLKYDFIIHPGGNIDKIALKYRGTDNLSIKNKELIVSTSIGQNKELYPYTYQVINNERNELKAKYIVEGDVVKFKVKDYSPNSTIIIDPTLVFFTYTGSTADNWGFTATYGPDGSFFSGGIAFGNGYPTSPGAYQTTFKGGQSQPYDIAIMKLTPDGKNRVYATYIGGSGNEQPHSLIVDPQGNLILAGRTNSLDYPITSPVFGSGGGWDIIVTKLNASGSALIGSMRIGGSGDDGVNIKDKNVQGTKSLNRNYGDDARSEVIIDGANNIYVASCTQSTINTIFPTTSGVFQPTPGLAQDGVVLKLNANCNTVLFSSFIGGKGDDAAYVLALGKNNDIYIAGGTGSTDLPEISSSGVISTTNSGGVCDGFVIEISNNGSTAIKGTYLGTSSPDQVYGIQTDKSGNVYVMGTTEGSWPVINANIFGAANSKQFISKLQPDLSAYIYSTTFGSGSALPNISPTAFLVDRCENVYVSGWGGKSNLLEQYGTGTTKGMPVTLNQNPIKTQTDASGSDFYFFVLQKNAVAQLFGGFFGQEDPPEGGNPPTFGDHVDGGTSRFDQSGVIYQAICANCGKTVDFQGTPGTWSPTNQALPGQGQCNLGMLKIKMNFAGVEAGPQASINGVVNDTSGCVPLTVNFTDTLQKGKSYVWDFGDGTPKVTTVSSNVSHTYNATGYYLVTLIAIDNTTCNVADTGYIHIKAGNNKATLDFVANKLPPCTNLSYSFSNLSFATFSSFKNNSFTWDFGDGSPRITAGIAAVTHTYAGAGTYLVKLILQDTSFCNSPDSITKTLRLSPIVKAQFNTPAKGCVPYNAVFENTSLGGLNFTWDFGDGSTSTADNPTHLYSSVGIYNVKLYAFDSTSCNKIDSAFFTITVVDIPVASFTFGPNPPQENTFTQFTNLAIGANRYLWKFGDGDSSTEVNPRHLFNATGTFNVCLTAINDAGCSDDTCMQVSALINPLLDVPNAFTPGKFGANGVVGVKGFGIKDMHWIIYNRWGQKVFESTNPSDGWDGTYKGKLQPMDVYTYTLDVVFSDGNKKRKTGDITLIR
ncbi:MAG: PKD domain-containing protein [Bacteroidota bacterium]|nr:PKD domain-containing protein [Bacteroidota bacterium]